LEKFEKEKKILCHEKAVLKAENKVMKAKVADLKARLESNSYNSYSCHQVMVIKRKR